ncbi:hypothetical protein [Luteitalea sp.]|uniref:hypothetical protein n=1 Tax=Luteitalea sp. TaxID=2004800 RepID=UPI000A6E55A9|nr:hypothetical protein [Luteitalea sp.]
MQPPRPHGQPPAIVIGADTRHASARHPLAPVDSGVESSAGGPVPLVGTRDPRLVRAWASHHGAEPATGEATASGPATVSVNDLGSGLRFNFPGASRFRDVTWDEWLAHFETAQLVFVFERTASADDTSSPRVGGALYRVVTAADWSDRPLATLAEDHSA